MELLECKDLCKQYNAKEVLKNVNLKPGGGTLCHPYSGGPGPPAHRRHWR